MRKVSFEIYENKQWVKKEGMFHQWAPACEEFESGPGNYTVAIVEESTGQVHEVHPTKIVFQS